MVDVLQLDMKKEFPIIIDSQALINDEIIFSAGKIGIPSIC